VVVNKESAPGKHGEKRTKQREFARGPARPPTGKRS
jgi:hypothetical protein